MRGRGKDLLNNNLMLTQIEAHWKSDFGKRATLNCAAGKIRLGPPPYNDRRSENRTKGHRGIFDFGFWIFDCGRPPKNRVGTA
jgi:hypothetical protein